MDKNIITFTSKSSIEELKHANYVQFLTIDNLRRYCGQLEDKVKHLEALLVHKGKVLEFKKESK